jgi:hypothetical protein
MKIDRSLFLVLTGSIAGAAAACHVYVGTDEPQTPATAASAQPGSSVAAPTAPPAPTAPAAPTATGPRRVVPGHQMAKGGPTPNVTPPAPVPPQPPQPAPSSCLGDGAATPGDCNALTAPMSGPSCEGLSFAKDRCNVYKTYFKPTVAAAAYSCLNQPQGMCASPQTYACGQNALKQACADSTVTQLCSIAATSCKTTAADCSAMVSGLNDQGKQQVASCVAKGCGAGLYSCIEGLSSAPSPSTEGTKPPPKK